MDTTETQRYVIVQVMQEGGAWGDAYVTLDDTDAAHVLTGMRAAGVDRAHVRLSVVEAPAGSRRLSNGRE